MKASYQDITSRINVPPIWWDSNGVPRYSPFHPHLLPNIYADQALHFTVKCQDCGREFAVAAQSDVQSQKDRDDLVQGIYDRKVYYGDPPSHGCVGDSMMSVPVKVINLWMRDERRRIQWGIVPVFQSRDLIPDWAKES